MALQMWISQFEIQRKELALLSRPFHQRWRTAPFVHSDMTADDIRIAVVTGASGFIASELVKQLLEKGYNVRATVRSVANEEKVAHLKRLAEALPGNLKLYEADLLKEGSFDKVISGADFVFHTASPFVRSFEDPQRDLVDPAVKGTKNVLGAVTKSLGTVKRVVLTSSFAAIIKIQSGPSNPPRYTEADWNNESTIENGAYRVSKTSAEKVAWETAKQAGFDLVTINPTFVVGPILSGRTDAVSIQTVKTLVEGGEANLMPWVCDVRDVARAHVLGAENPDAKNQRFIVSQADTRPPRFFTDALKERFPSARIAEGKDEPSKPVIDNSKALKVLGLGKLHDPATSIVDMAVTLIQKGVAKPQAG